MYAKFSRTYGKTQLVYNKKPTKFIFDCKYGRNDDMHNDK